jgi:hypothetical protein
MENWTVTKSKNKHEEGGGAQNGVEKSILVGEFGVSGTGISIMRMLLKAG